MILVLLDTGVRRTELVNLDLADLDLEGQRLRVLHVQHLLGHSTLAMVRRYSATYDAEKAARAHERFSPADRMGERLG
jgi:integrase